MPNYNEMKSRNSNAVEMHQALKSPGSRGIVDLFPLHEDKRISGWVHTQKWAALRREIVALGDKQDDFAVQWPSEAQAPRGDDEAYLKGAMPVGFSQQVSQPRPPSSSPIR